MDTETVERDAAVSVATGGEGKIERRAISINVAGRSVLIDGSEYRLDDIPHDHIQTWLALRGLAVTLRDAKDANHAFGKLTVGAIPEARAAASVRLSKIRTAIAHALAHEAAMRQARPRLYQRRWRC